jgi:hypothetical protein
MGIAKLLVHCSIAFRDVVLLINEELEVGEPSVREIENDPVNDTLLIFDIFLDTSNIRALDAAAVPIVIPVR